MIELNMPVHRMLAYDGYGRFIQQMLDAMLVGGDFDVRPLLVEQFDWPGWAQTAAGIDHSRLTLSVMPANCLRSVPARQWLLSMYEADRLPDGWVSAINTRAERLIVPCQWCADVFQKNGVTTPIHIIHGGVDVEHLPLLARPRAGARPYTFIALADRADRKGWDTALIAFCEAFRADDDVALIVKARNADILDQFPADGIRDGVSRKIRFWIGDVEDVRDVFGQADCCVYPARADGWGMWCREAAVCGLPVIATDYSGTAVGCEHWAFPLRDYQIVQCALPDPATPGRWANVNYQEAAHWMRYCYKNQDAARAKGACASAWLRANQTWAHTASALKQLIMDIDVTRPQEWQAVFAAQEHQIEVSTQRLTELIRTNHDVS